VRPLRSAACAILMGVGLGAVGVVPVAAQTSKGTPWELAATVSYARGLPLSAISGNETEASGAQLPLFTAQSRLDPSVGLEASLTRHLAGVFSAEVDGALTHSTYRTTVLSDFENATLTDATTRATDYSVSGALVLTFARHSPLQYFVRLGGGWRRELSEDQTLSEDGRLVLAGGGVKYWWGSHRKTPSHLGIRVDVGVIGRSGGVGLPTTIRFAPAASAGVSLRF
jgi:hypothetical protein